MALRAGFGLNNKNKQAYFCCIRAAGHSGAEGDRIKTLTPIALLQG
ncbi:MAG: hypothetical protein HUK21_11385 [Fibrobacteraceae bacterium]|nr:hypothetical protein [Fibrobacteraceae bacterium]